MNAVFLPVLIPFIAAIACMFVRSSLRANRVISGISMVAMPLLAAWLLARVHAGGPMVLRAGNWPDGYGIVLVLDLFSALMILFTSVTQLACWAYIVAGGLSEKQETFLIHPLFLILGAGVNWAFITGDLFNLFVSFEIILLASYVLISHGNGQAQVRESYKYVVLNIIASTLFLVTAGYAYGSFGALNLAELAVRISEAGYPPQAFVLGTLMLITFGMKAAMFPLFFWLPDAYPKAPAAIVAYFSGVLTKVGIYCLYRMFPLLFPGAALMEWFQPILLAIGGLTMIVGVLCALSQMTMRRILTFHIVSQIGYMIFGLAIFTPVALAFGMFMVLHNILVKSSLLMVADCVKHNEGSDDLKKVKGLMNAYPVLAVIFLFAALSLAGIPPLSGFYGKFGLVLEGIEQRHFFVVAVSVVTGLFTLSSMIKIWRYGFWGAHPGDDDEPVRKTNNAIIAATGGLVFASVVVAALSGPIGALSLRAGQELLSRDAYVGAVLGERGVEALHTPRFQEVEE